MTSSAMRHTLRAAAMSDAQTVAVLLRQAGGLKVRSAAGWRWLFEDNPMHRRQDPPPEMGWVLERGGELYGYLGNIHLDYVFDGRALRAATCTSYYVREEARSESTRLMTAFFRQPRVELFMSTTANAASEPIYRLFKAEVPKDASFSRGYVWVADDRRVIEDVLARAPIPHAVTHGLAALAAPVSRLARSASGFAAGPRERAAAHAPLAFAPAELDERFDRFCETLAAAPGLRVRRNAAALRWYLSDPDAGGVPRVFAIPDERGELIGYAATALHRPAETAAAQLRILDLVVRPGDENAVAPLLEAVLAYARETGAGLVYCPPGGAALAAQLEKSRPYTHVHVHASHFVRAAKRGDTDAFIAPSVWQATGLDGDTPFCIEHEPTAPRRTR